MTKFILLNESHIISPVDEDETVGDVFKKINKECSEWFMDNLNTLSDNEDEYETIKEAFFLYFALRATEGKDKSHDIGRVEKPYRDALNNIENLFNTNYKTMRANIVGEESLTENNKRIADFNKAIEIIEQEIAYICRVNKHYRKKNRERVQEMLLNTSIKEWRHNVIIAKFNDILDSFEKEIADKTAFFNID